MGAWHREKAFSIENVKIPLVHGEGGSSLTPTSTFENFTKYGAILSCLLAIQSASYNHVAVVALRKSKQLRQHFKCSYQFSR